MAYKSKSQHKRLEKHLDFLSQLSKAKRKHQRAELLRIATPEQIFTICECVKNVLSGAVPGIQSSKKKYLKRFRPIFRRLISKDRTIPLEAKRGILIQQGGFLPALLAPVVGIVGSLLGNLIGNL